MRPGFEGLHWSELAVLSGTLEKAIDFAEARLPTAEKVEKAAPPSPLTTKGFDAWVDEFAKRVVKASSAADKKAVAAMVAALKQPWASMTAARRAKLVEKATSKLALTAAQQAKVVKAVKGSMEDLLLATKTAADAAHGWNVGASFSAIDRKVIDHAASSQAHFIRDAYGQRQAALSAQARKIVADGIDKGFDSATIGAELGRAMTTAGVLRAETYWQVVSSIYAARSRSLALASSYASAGIELARITAILDEQTTEMCIFLHDKLIPVGKVLDRFEQVAESDPEEVKFLQPFLRMGSAEGGGSYLYYTQADGSRVNVADIVTPAAGKRDTIGEYRQHVSDADLVDAGIGFPAYHGFAEPPQWRRFVRRDREEPWTSSYRIGRAPLSSILATANG